MRSFVSLIHDVLPLPCPPLATHLVWGLGVEVWGLGFEVWSLGFAEAVVLALPQLPPKPQIPNPKPYTRRRDGLGTSRRSEPRETCGERGGERSAEYHGSFLGRAGRGATQVSSHESLFIEGFRLSKYTSQKL